MEEVTVNGIRLCFDRRGDGPPVLLVCGTGQRRDDWELFGRAALDDAGLHSVAFDNRGMPPSDCPPPPYTVDEMADDTIGLIEALGLAPCGIVGYSLGGTITQRVALRRPDLLRAAVLIAGCGNYSRLAAMRCEVDAAIFRGGGAAADRYHHISTLAAALTPEQARDDDYVESISQLLAPATSAWSGDGRIGQQDADATWAREDHLSELEGMSVPCLVIAHEHDRYFPPEHLREAADRIPQADYLEIADEPHLSIDALTTGLRAAAEFLGDH